MCLTKGHPGVLLLFIAILFLAWDSPKRVAFLPYLWGGILLGSIPVVGWYGLQWQLKWRKFCTGHAAGTKFRSHLGRRRKNRPPPGTTCWSWLKYSWPWLIFLAHRYLANLEKPQLHLGQAAAGVDCGLFL